jgi:hypothetical protein
MGPNKFKRILANSWQQNFAAAFTENSPVVRIKGARMPAHLFVKMNEVGSFLRDLDEAVTRATPEGEATARRHGAMR